MKMSTRHCSATVIALSCSHQWTFQEASVAAAKLARQARMICRVARVSGVRPQRGQVNSRASMPVPV